MIQPLSPPPTAFVPHPCPLYSSHTNYFLASQASHGSSLLRLVSRFFLLPESYSLLLCLCNPTSTFSVKVEQVPKKVQTLLFLKKSTFPLQHISQFTTMHLYKCLINFFSQQTINSMTAGTCVCFCSQIYVWHIAQHLAILNSQALNSQDIIFLSNPYIMF